MWGIDHHIESFVRIIDNDTLGHSYCFFGDEGVGKTTCAQAIASYIETKTMDVHSLVDSHVFIEDEKKSFGIEEMRGVRDFCSRAPLVSKRRTAIIQCGAHITDQAQSALLKLLEEPPEHALVILITRNKDIFFPPILSRVQSIYFRRFTKKQIVDFLVFEKKINGHSAEDIARKSFGSIGRALSFLSNDETKNIDSAQWYVENDIEQYYSDDPKKHSQLLWELLKKEKDIKQFSTNEVLQKKAIEVIKNKV